MSYWTYITAVVELDLMDLFGPQVADDDCASKLSQVDIDRKAQEIYEGLPKVTGSEFPAEVFMNRGDWVGISCMKHPVEEKIEWVDYRFKYFLTFWGALRDRRKPDVDREFEAVVKYLKEKVGEGSVGVLVDITEDA